MYTYIKVQKVKKNGKMSKCNVIFESNLPSFVSEVGGDELIMSKNCRKKLENKLYPKNNNQ